MLLKMALAQFQNTKRMKHRLGHYIRDIETEKIVVLVFGTPDKDFPES